MARIRSRMSPSEQNEAAAELAKAAALKTPQGRAAKGASEATKRITGGRVDPEAKATEAAINAAGKARSKIKFSI